MRNGIITKHLYNSMYNVYLSDQDNDKNLKPR